MHNIFSEFTKKCTTFFCVLGSGHKAAVWNWVPFVCFHVFSCGCLAPPSDMRQLGVAFMKDCDHHISQRSQFHASWTRPSYLGQKMIDWMKYSFKWNKHCLAGLFNLWGLFAPIETVPRIVFIQNWGSYQQYGISF